MSPLTDTALALVFVLFVVSSTSSAVLEGIRKLFQRRAVTLHHSIGLLLDGTEHPDPASRTAAVYRTPHIRHLVDPKHLSRFDGREQWGRRRRGEEHLHEHYGPDHIPSDAFALALRDAFPDRSKLPSSLRVQLSGNPDRADEADRKVDLAADAAWFERSMEVVSRRYKRESRRWLFVVGLAAAVLGNISLLTVADVVWNDETSRAALVAEAEAVCGGADATEASCSEAVAGVEDGVRSPIGWQCHGMEKGSAGEADWTWCSPWSRLGEFSGSDWTASIIGWLLTGLGTALGAPFWYELLRTLLARRARS